MKDVIQHHQEARAERPLKRQDIVVLLKLLQPAAREAKLWQLALELGISQAELAHSIARCRYARLLKGADHKPIKSALKQCLLVGLQYFFAVEAGPVMRGVRTAQSAKPLVDLLSEDEIFVWPDEMGDSRGHSIEPLFKSVPAIVKKDPKLYELLSLVDALRLGYKGRVLQLASQELEKRIDEALP